MKNYTGIIDNYIENENEIVLMGWCFLEENELYKSTILFCLKGYYPHKIIEVRYESVLRNDFIQKNNGNVGFKISFSKEITIDAIFNGEFHVCAIFDDIEFLIPIWKKLRSNYLEKKINHIIFAKNKETVLKSKIEETEFTNIAVSVGTKSLAEDAVLGKNGMAFLFGGTNNVQNLYNKYNETDYLKWEQVFKNRASIMNELNITFIQMIVPEKQSVYPEFYPYKIDTPTQLYTQLNIFLNSNSFRGLYVDTLSLLVKNKENNLMFREIDTHLTFHGSMLLFNSILNLLSFDNIKPPRDFSSVYRIDDLSERFAPFPLYSKNNVIPVIETWEFARNYPKLVYENKIPSDKHIGIKMIWENINNYSEKKVLIFGNSFCERGGSYFSFTWWFIRFFKEVHFVWSPSIDIEYIDKIKPDIVFCQTIERFLTQVPSK